MEYARDSYQKRDSGPVFGARGFLCKLAPGLLNLCESLRIRRGPSSLVQEEALGLAQARIHFPLGWGWGSHSSVGWAKTNQGILFSHQKVAGFNDNLSRHSSLHPLKLAQELRQPPFKKDLLFLYMCVCWCIKCWHPRFPLELELWWLWVPNVGAGNWIPLRSGTSWTSHLAQCSLFKEKKIVGICSVV